MRGVHFARIRGTFGNQVDLALSHELDRRARTHSAWQSEAGKYREISGDDLQKFIDGLEKKAGQRSVACSVYAAILIQWLFLQQSSGRAYRTTNVPNNPKPSTLKPPP